MSITPGTRIGSYEITTPLGKGGMGEVYRARDLKLKREVAIKVLPDEFSRDADRVSRFQREAEVLAALNHPNIAAIYDFEEANETRFLVLELVEGETLADRILRGRFAVEEALEIAKSICDALEAAHDKGIVHRDLKPANVKISPDGKVKVLDFGLAKALEDGPANAAVSNSPTMVNSFAATNAGVILGTAAYMSPEQARGSGADRHSDIFAFGCVLYEMLTGRQAFQGETISDILASVLAREPDFTLLPLDANSKLAQFLRRCLEKNRKGRWHCVGDARAELESIAAAPKGADVVAQPSTERRPLWKRAIPVLAAASLVGAITGFAVWTLKPSVPRAVARFSFFLPDKQQLSTTFHSLSISPDGTQIIYVADNRLYLRSIAEGENKPIPGSDAQGITLASPSFSPDGASILFTDVAGPAGAIIKKIPVSGGSPVTLQDVRRRGPDFPVAASWDADGIVFCSAGPDSAEIMRISASGGKGEPLVTLKDGYATDAQMLPSGQAVLFTIVHNRDTKIVVQSLKSGERKTLIEDGSAARYVPTGHIVYAVGGTLFAVQFDLRRLEIVGGPVPVIEGVMRDFNGGAEFSISDNGSIAYVPGPVLGRGSQSIALIERSGEVKPFALPPGPYAFPRISPNGKSIVFGTDDGKEAIVWIYDLSGASSMRRLTFGGANRFPIWSADGERVAFQSDREGDLGIFWQRADGTGTAERLTKSEKGGEHIPDSWSPDGQRFSFTAVKGNERAVWIFSLPDKKATLFAAVPSSNLGSSAFSPDGKWLAYHSNETSRYEIFVQPFPPTGTKYQISKDAQSHNPLWSPDGKELFYIPGPDQFLRVSLTTKPSFTFSNAVPVPRRFIEFGPPVPRTYDITPDGKRFVGIIAAGQTQTATPAASQIQVVLNWFEELKRRVPVR